MKTIFQPNDMLELSHETEAEKKEHSEEVKKLMRITQDEADAYYDACDLKHLIAEYQERLEKRPLSALIELWLKNPDWTPETSAGYEHYITDMKERAIIPELNHKGEPFTFLDFNLLDHHARIKFMNEVPEWSENTRRLRISCYLAFINYLHKISYGSFRKVAVKLKGLSASTKAHNARAAKALALGEWQQFISALRTLDARDALIARCLLQISTIESVLSLRLSQIDFDTNTIEFQKTKGSEATITYPALFMQELKKYVNHTAQNRATSELVFTTRNGKKVVRSRCNYSFAKASKMAQIKKATPYSIRATYITLVKGEKIDGNLLLTVPEADANKKSNDYI